MEDYVYMCAGDYLQHEDMIYTHTDGAGKVFWADVADKAIPVAQWEAERQAVFEEAKRKALEDDELEKLSLQRIRNLLTPDIVAALHDWHRAKGWECSAHSEGMPCCIDELYE
jgi:hypothetical protein